MKEPCDISKRPVVKKYMKSVNFRKIELNVGLGRRKNDMRGNKWSRGDGMESKLVRASSSRAHVVESRSLKKPDKRTEVANPGMCEDDVSPKNSGKMCRWDAQL